MKQMIKAVVVMVFCCIPFGSSHVEASSPNRDEQALGITIHPDASQLTEAKGTMTENVDTTNQDYVIGSGGVANRQFVTFTSQSGKVFHLIINHDKDSEQVQLLTEVSEQDLLHLIESKQTVSLPPQKVEPEQKEEKIEKQPETKESSSSVIFLALIVAAVLGVGYYLKVVKPKSEHNFEEFEESEDFISEGEEDD